VEKVAAVGVAIERKPFSRIISLVRVVNHFPLPPEIKPYNIANAMTPPVLVAPKRAKIRPLDNIAEGTRTGIA
jgi:hypothetical protein